MAGWCSPGPELPCSAANLISNGNWSACGLFCWLPLLSVTFTLLVTFTAGDLFWWLFYLLMVTIFTVDLIIWCGLSASGELKCRWPYLMVNFNAGGLICCWPYIWWWPYLEVGYLLVALSNRYYVHILITLSTGALTRRLLCLLVALLIGNYIYRRPYLLVILSNCNYIYWWAYLLCPHWMVNIHIYTADIIWWCMVTLSNSNNIYQWPYPLVPLHALDLIWWWLDLTVTLYTSDLIRCCPYMLVTLSGYGLI